MTNCKVCYKTKAGHSRKLWVLHQQSQICAFCHKTTDEHSSKLWNMHQLAIDEGRFCIDPRVFKIDHKKREKLYPITVGFSRTGVARVCRSNADPPHDVEFIPIYMSCTECGLYLGSDEEDYADILDGTCLKCFREMTDQIHPWYDIPPAKKATKKEVND